MKKCSSAFLVLSIALISFSAGAFAVSNFSDVPENHWGIDAINWAAGLKLIQGDDKKDTFRPDDFMSRAELTVVLKRYHDYLQEMGVFKENSEENYALDCRITRNGVSLSYPCKSNPPHEAPEGSEVLTAWHKTPVTPVPEEPIEDGDPFFNDDRQLYVYRYMEGETGTSHFKNSVQDIEPESINISGFPALSYTIDNYEGMFEDMTAWYYAIYENDPETEDPLYLITLSVAHKDPEIKQAYANQLMTMLELLELPMS